MSSNRIFGVIFMEKTYIGQWFKYGITFGKVVSELDSPSITGEPIYHCAIFGEIYSYYIGIDLKEVKLLKFLDCPEYYDIIILYGCNNWIGV